MKVFYPNKQVLKLEINRISISRTSAIFSFSQRFAIKGVGYKAFYRDGYIFFELGSTHYFIVFFPLEFSIITRKGGFSLKSSNHQSLTSLSKRLKGLKTINPYTGKGIRFYDEEICLKVGKVRA